MAVRHVHWIKWVCGRHKVFISNKRQRHRQTGITRESLFLVVGLGGWLASGRMWMSPLWNCSIIWYSLEYYWHMSKLVNISTAQLQYKRALYGDRCTCRVLIFHYLVFSVSVLQSPIVLLQRIWILMCIQFRRVMMPNTYPSDIYFLCFIALGKIQYSSI